METNQPRKVSWPVRGPKQEWETVERTVKVVGEVPMPAGNQKLYKVVYDDGTTGTLWANQLQGMT